MQRPHQRCSRGSAWCGNGCLHACVLPSLMLQSLNLRAGGSRGALGGSGSLGCRSTAWHASFPAASGRWFLCCWPSLMALPEKVEESCRLRQACQLKPSQGFTERATLIPRCGGSHLCQEERAPRERGCRASGGRALRGRHRDHADGGFLRGAELLNVCMGSSWSSCACRARALPRP